MGGFAGGSRLARPPAVLPEPDVRPRGRCQPWKTQYVFDLPIVIDGVTYPPSHLNLAYSNGDKLVVPVVDVDTNPFLYMREYVFDPPGASTPAFSTSYPIGPAQTASGGDDVTEPWAFMNTYSVDGYLYGLTEGDSLFEEKLVRRLPGDSSNELIHDSEFDAAGTPWKDYGSWTIVDVGGQLYGGGGNIFDGSSSIFAVPKTDDLPVAVHSRADAHFSLFTGTVDGAVWGTLADHAAWEAGGFEGPLPTHLFRWHPDDGLRVLTDLWDAPERMTVGYFTNGLDNSVYVRAQGTIDSSILKGYRVFPDMTYEACLCYGAPYGFDNPETGFEKQVPINATFASTPDGSIRWGSRREDEETTLVKLVQIDSCT